MKQNTQTWRPENRMSSAPIATMPKMVGPISRPEMDERASGRGRAQFLAPIRRVTEDIRDCQSDGRPASQRVHIVVVGHDYLYRPLNSQNINASHLRF